MQDDRTVRLSRQIKIPVAQGCSSCIMRWYPACVGIDESPNPRDRNSRISTLNRYGTTLQLEFKLR